MTADQYIRLTEAIAKLIGAVAWPLIVVVVLSRVLPAFVRMFPDMDTFAIDAFGFKASAARKKAEATEALTAAVSRDAVSALEKHEGARTAKAAVDQAVSNRLVRKLDGRRVLWVDDKPSGNASERMAFEALGVRFQLALGSEEAVELARKEPFDLIISDMSRPEGKTAGLSLLSELRASGLTTPYVIYAGGTADKNLAEALRLGAIGCTNRPDELFRLVTRTLSEIAG